MRRARAVAAGLAAVFGAILAPAAAQAAPATFTVTSSGDSGAGTLRQAILDANANANPSDVDTIAFNIAPSGFHVLSITSAPLPGATEPVKIDGLTQPGSSPDNPRIVLVGSAPTANGLFLSSTAKGSTVSGLIIQSFPGEGIAIAGDGTTVTGCWVGINAAGARAPNGSGILVEGASDVSIAQTAAGRNVVSGNSSDGILVHEATHTTISQNYIGTDVSGGGDRANAGDGIELAGGAVSMDTLITDNTISGNTDYGVRISDAGITGTAIRGNFIGLGADGFSAVPNARGVGLLNGTTDTTVGGTNAGDGNTFAYNAVSGVELNNAVNNLVQGNTIGMNTFGSAAGNSSGVVLRGGANHNTIGGTTGAARNIISGNTELGIDIFDSGTSDNTIAGNLIGLSASSFRVPNHTGISITAGANNVIGGNTAGAGNTISGNNAYGVILGSAGPTTIQGNKIGVTPGGSAARGNGADGIFASSDNVTIGGATEQARNVISANENNGVFLTGDDNVVQGNYIGSDGTGLAARGNDLLGIGVAGDDNRIGGSGPGEGNLISATRTWGVALFGGDGSIIKGNKIGTDLTGAHELGTFQGSGIVLQPGGANITNTTIGGTGAGDANTIAFNQSGVYLFDNGINGNTSGTMIRGNSIFSSSVNMGIELKGDNAITPNDPIDPDAGANGLQNFPVLSSAVTTASGTTIAGTLNTHASQPGYTIDLYSNPSCHPLGNGDGKTYLGSVSGLGTDRSGNASFQASLSAPVPVGQLITATATDSSGNTSEFSTCRAVTAPPPAQSAQPPAETGGPGTSETPSGPPGPSGPTGPTVTIPALKLTAAKQKFLKQKSIVLKLASDSDAQYTATGSVKGTKLKGKNGSLKGGARPVTVKLVASRKLLAQARTAFRKKQKLTATVTIVLTNGAGKAAPVVRKIKLSR